MGALSPRAIAEMEPDLIALVDRLLDGLAAKGKVDLIDDFAVRDPDRGDRQSARCAPWTSASRCATGRWRFWARWSR